MSVGQFEELRILEDREIHASVLSIAKDPQALYGLGKYWLGGMVALGPVRWALSAYLQYAARNIHSVQHLHSSLYSPLRRILDRHMTSCETVGLDRLKGKKGPWLFISNHRDIALDSLILNVQLHEAGIPPARVAIGDNLLELPRWGSLLMRAVGCFMVSRVTGSRRQQYQSHQTLSGYIRHLLLEKGLSVWLAQQSGRSLDGRDRTDPTVLKMLHLCDRKTSFAGHMDALSILPVTLSYEYDPCDCIKAQRLAAQERSEEWKSDYARESQNGLLGDKGRVCLRVAEALPGGLESAEVMAKELDRRIHAGYRLWPTAFAAARHLGYSFGVDCPWSDEELDAAQAALQARCQGLDALEERHFWQYYAGPVPGAGDPV